VVHQNAGDTATSSHQHQLVGGLLDTEQEDAMMISISANIMDQSIIRGERRARGSRDAGEVTREGSMNGWDSFVDQYLVEKRNIEK